MLLCPTKLCVKEGSQGWSPWCTCYMIEFDMVILLKHWSWGFLLLLFSHAVGFSSECMEHPLSWNWHWTCYNSCQSVCACVFAYLVANLSMMTMSSKLSVQLKGLINLGLHVGMHIIFIFHFKVFLMCLIDWSIECKGLHKNNSFFQYNGNTMKHWRLAMFFGSILLPDDDCR